jgi:hypothetical protein
MTPVNMAKHRNNPNMPFWRMIKEGYDHFEITKQEPKVDFCEKKYVFDAVKAPNATRDPVFEASGKCPAYVVPDELAEATRQKQQNDDAEMAKFVARGTPVAKLNTGIDGGMNKVFAAALPDGNTGLSEGGDGGGRLSLALNKLPGTIPVGHVNPPHAPEDPAFVSSTPAPTVAPNSVARVAVASAAPSGESDGFFSNLARKVGFGSADTTATTTPAPPPAPTKPKAGDNKLHAQGSIPKNAAKTEAKQAASRPALKPSLTDTAAAPAPASSGMVAGAQPIVQTNSFDNRFSAAK